MYELSVPGSFLFTFSDGSQPRATEPTHTKEAVDKWRLLQVNSYAVTRVKKNKGGAKKTVKLVKNKELSSDSQCPCKKPGEVLRISAQGKWRQGNLWGLLINQSIPLLRETLFEKNQVREIGGRLLTSAFSLQIHTSPCTCIDSHGHTESLTHRGRRERERTWKESWPGDPSYAGGQDIRIVRF